MEITLNGDKHTIPDASTHLAVDDNGECLVYVSEPRLSDDDAIWYASFLGGFGSHICKLAPPADFTKCCAKVFDGAVIDFD